MTWSIKAESVNLRHNFLVPTNPTQGKNKGHQLTNCLSRDTYPPLFQHPNLTPKAIKWSPCGWVTVMEVTFPQTVTNWNGETGSDWLKRKWWSGRTVHPFILYCIQVRVMVVTNWGNNLKMLFLGDPGMFPSDMLSVMHVLGLHQGLHPVWHTRNTSTVTHLNWVFLKLNSNSSCLSSILEISAPSTRYLAHGELLISMIVFF